MKKNVIKLNEDTLRQIVTESVKKVLNEGEYGEANNSGLYLVKYTKSNVHASCLPYVFSSEKVAQDFINDACYYPEEFEVIEAELWNNY